MKKIQIRKIGAYIVLLIGFIESSIQFFSGRSLWLDESFVALNLIHKTPKELLNPLDYSQVAPILFLQIEWILSRMVPGMDFALRIFPLLCFWGAMVLFYYILNILFKKNTHLVAVGLALFAFNTTLLYYSSEIKQYMCDVFVCLLLYYILLKNYKTERWRYLHLLLAGSVSILLSNAAIVILSSMGAYLFYNHLFKQKINIKYAIAVTTCWCVVFLIYYSCFIHNHPTKAIMVTYWTDANAFMPLNRHIFSWFVTRYNATFFFTFYFGTKIGIVISVMYGLGIFGLFRLKKYKLAILLFLPILIHLALSGLKMYPFESRLYLYICPLIIIVCCCGLELINNLVAKSYIIIPLNVIIALILLRIILIHPFPLMQHDDVKDCIKEINTNVLTSDKIYITNLQGPPFKYYKDIKYLASNATIIYGRYTQGYSESPDNVNKLNQQKGRLWVISQNDAMHEDKFIAHYIDSAGYKKIYGFTSVGGTNANLYQDVSLNKISR